MGDRVGHCAPNPTEPDRIVSGYDPSKREFAEDLIVYTGTFTKIVYTSFKGDPIKEVGKLYKLHQSSPRFMIQLCDLQVDIAYVPFVERFQIFLSEQQCQIDDPIPLGEGAGVGRLKDVDNMAIDQYNSWFTFSEYEEAVTIQSCHSIHARELAMVNAFRSMMHDDIDGNQGTTSKDFVQIPIGPVMRARAKKFKDVLNGLIQEAWAQANA
ncbi:Glutathione S-transferase L1 [Morella rubra]|uniref:Glutathione S-transferase L1 n=1 Tax=Morella rubra TaxID=262757 RepID=A0A6A1UUY6_9ROSI|nr:Glutathione S-transferase L1 [Morella rubra]